MKTTTNDYRSLIYSTPNGFDVFVWSAAIQHAQMTRSLDVNKNLNKYPNGIKYVYSYNECQILMKGDEVGSVWCFPFVIWQGSIVSNLESRALDVLNDEKKFKNVFQISDNQWESLSKKQEFRL